MERPLTSRPTVLERWSLDAGEFEAIGLAIELGDALVVLDDRPARAVARRLGLLVVGSLGLAVRAKESHLIPAARPLIVALIANGLYADPELYARVLTLTGEAQ